MTRQVIIAIMFCGLLGACDQKNSNEEVSKKAALAAKGEATLMSDPERAAPELENRLAQNVRVDGGLVLVHTEMGLSVLPVSTPWTVQCGVGMTVTFGNSVTSSLDRAEESKDVEYSTGNDVRLILTATPIFKECDILAPRVGKRLLAILGWQDQPARQ
jgi:hypothetical protein